MDRAQEVTRLVGELNTKMTTRTRSDRRTFFSKTELVGNRTEDTRVVGQGLIDTADSQSLVRQMLAECSLYPQI